ncbi:MBL fold metallo-hydrolase [Pseudorhodoferax sp. Leaf274]|uniref:MBL fold metallo-hydrolase n=1 Tax=Pseudorhodoferax sp. Leaf274 TaxID=1736318 RepID=UPI0009E951A0|nr:MBL fold metallo-hydrolase [Pseudorhodoferax sp. Leaf274]
MHLHPDTRPARRALRRATAFGAALLCAGALSLTGCAGTSDGTPRGAARGQPKDQAPAFYRMPLGDFQVTALSDGTVKLPLDAIMSNIPAGRARQLLDAAFESTPPEASVNAFLVHTGDRLLLVDAGAGKLFGAGAGHLLENLKAAGYAPGDIDAVLLTHLHKDHSGGLAVDGRRLFPRATVYVHKAERDFRFDLQAEAKAPPGARPSFAEAREALSPYEAAGKVVLFEGEGELFQGVRTRAAHGHTPGHTLYEVESRGARILFIGDIIHAGAVQFPHPEATIAFDTDPHAAASDRAALLRDLAAGKTLVGAAHISFPGLGYVAVGSAGEAYRWMPRPYSR